MSDEQASTIERMFVSMNLRGQDPCRIGGGQRSSDPFLVWGAVSAAKLTAAEEGLILYMATGSRTGLAAASTAARHEAYQLRDKQGWQVNKAQLVEAVALTAVYDVCSPATYEHNSNRQWAREIGLEDHKDWPKRWRNRYYLVRGIVQGWLDEAIEKLERQYGSVEP